MSPERKKHEPSDIEEVGWVAAVEGEDVHSGHSETCTVNKAANVAVELDEVEVSLLGFDFGRLLLRNVSESEDVLLTEVSIVVEAELGVHAKLLVSRINIQKRAE